MTILILERNIVGVWVKAMQHLFASDRHEDFNLILEVEAPTEIDAADRKVGAHVNRFLTAHGAQALHTVANTIFPNDIYQRYGRQGVFENYPDHVYPRLQKCSKNSWGTYFHRMVRRTGSDGKAINPLGNLVARLQTEIGGGGHPKRARYELNLVDPFLDLVTADPTLPGDTKAMGGPCLSHLSFKLRSGSVALTAFYRSHYYVERALGNLLGLSNLQQFVAKECGLPPGPLTCISSMAKIDCGSLWRLTEVQQLLAECQSLLAEGRSTGTVPQLNAMNAA